MIVLWGSLKCYYLSNILIFCCSSHANFLHLNFLCQHFKLSIFFSFCSRWDFFRLVRFLLFLKSCDLYFLISNNFHFKLIFSLKIFNFDFVVLVWDEKNSATRNFFLLYVFVFPKRMFSSHTSKTLIAAVYIKIHRKFSIQFP